MSAFACQYCGAHLAFAGVRTAICPYCASGNVVERPPTPDQPTPRFAIGFAHDATRAHALLARWLGSRTIFADSAIARARVEDVRGIYLPAYLYSAATTTRYDASIGEHYTETEEVERTDAQGKRVTETRTVTRTEYLPLSGTHVGYITDVIVSASRGLPHAELGAIEPFELRQLRPYEPALVVGWIAEEFSRAADECLEQSRRECTDEVGVRLRRFLPGDSYADLSYRTTVRWESLEPVLLPVWVFAVRYRDDRPPLRVVINGQTGRVGGRVPLARWKVAIAVALAVLAIVAVVLLVRGHA